MKRGIDHIVIEVDDGKKCIFRVPKVLRRQKPEAYTPDVVSIGPFHYPGKRGKRKGHFQDMERVKQKYLDEILSGMKITLKELTAKVIEFSGQKNVGGFEEHARGFYAEPLDHISSEDFIKMMIVDGCFLIQLFRKCNYLKLRAFDDPVFNMDCMFRFICHDILLLENQLPWFVIHTLYGLTFDIYPGERSPLSILILKASTILPSLKHSCLSYRKHLHKNKCRCDAEVLHILDLVRTSIVCPSKTKDEAGKKAILHLEAVHEAIFDPDQLQMHTATALSKVGIKIQRVIRESMMDIQFEVGGWRNGVVLKIPQLNIGMLSECLFRNLIAIEQCYHGYSNEITSYAIFMDNLISSKEDMELLINAKVIGNWKIDEDGCKFFNNLYKDILYNKFYYVHLCKEVDVLYKKKLQHRQLLGENTRRQLNYFSNPWNVFYVIVGVFFLQIVPTILQTAYTIKQYYSP